MLLTEKEAGEKWCPHVRIARREDPDPTAPSENTVVISGCNPDALGGLRVPGSCRCIASGCAMWRNEKKKRSNSPISTEVEVLASDAPMFIPEHDEYLDPHLRVWNGLVRRCRWLRTKEDKSKWVVFEVEDRGPISERRGYCGLAGVPSVAP